MWSMSSRFELGKPASLQRCQQLLVELVAGLGKDLAGLLVDEFIGEIKAVKILVAHQQLLDAVFGELAGQARRDLLAGLDDDLRGLGIDQVEVGFMPR